METETETETVVANGTLREWVAAATDRGYTVEATTMLPSGVHIVAWDGAAHARAWLSCEPSFIEVRTNHPVEQVLDALRAVQHDQAAARVESYDEGTLRAQVIKERMPKLVAMVDTSRQIGLIFRHSEMIVSVFGDIRNNTVEAVVWQFRPEHYLDVLHQSDVIRTLTAPPRPAEPRFYMIVAQGGGLGLRGVALPPPPSEVPLPVIYGPSYPDWEAAIVSRLTTKTSGLVLVHGPPGTGKTSWIRRLPTLVPEKKILWIGREMTRALDGPALLTLLTEQGDPLILVIEDAEHMVLKRTTGDVGTSNLTSLLLNLTDGVLNDAVNCQMIVSFNASMREHEVDEALTRKGRLLGRRYFGPLDVADAKALSTALGKPDTFTASINRPMTLAEIAADDPVVDETRPAPPARRGGF